MPVVLPTHRWMIFLMPLDVWPINPSFFSKSWSIHAQYLNLKWCNVLFSKSDSSLETIANCILCNFHSFSAEPLPSGLSSGCVLLCTRIQPQAQPTLKNKWNLLRSHSQFKSKYTVLIYRVDRTDVKTENFTNSTSCLFASHEHEWLALACKF